MDLGLTDKRCVVTGGSRGIGLAVAERLVEEGAWVLLVARDAERLDAAGVRLGCDVLALDVTAPDAAEAVLATGVCDVLVNAAGSTSAIALDDLTDAEWQAQWDVHVMAAMRLMRTLAPAMAERGWGRVVNVSSSSGKRPSTANVAYAVAKTAQLALSRAYADAYASRGVLINAVAPGPVAGELWLGDGGLADQLAARSGGTREQAVDAAAAKIPLGRLATPAEIADVIVFLCSARAANVAGAAWSVDGGSVQTIV
ncbi:MAG: SDR family oxidoreductase [Baekduia sp.]